MKKTDDQPNDQVTQEEATEAQEDSKEKTTPTAETETEAAAPEETNSEAEIERLKEELAKAEAKTAEYLDNWQRTQAAYQNYRKRVETDKVAWRADAKAGLFILLLPVLDDFERAFNDQPDEIKDHTWLKGIQLVKQKLHHVLDIENVKPIDIKPGDDFDPYYHEAILCQETADFEDNQIIAETQRGYMQGERILRPSQVVVAKAPKTCEPIEIVEGEEEKGTEENVSEGQ